MIQFALTLSINGYKILYLFWNVFLALIPVLVVYYLAKTVDLKKWKQIKISGRVGFALLFLFWLFFLPNTAYLLTVVRHLVNYCSDFDRFRVCATGAWVPLFFFMYALIGVPTFYYALSKMSRVFKTLFGKTMAKVLPILMVPLTSIGVMFGLFERFNTWDLLTKPWFILEVTGSYFMNPVRLVDFLIFTAILYFIYYGVDTFITKIKK